MTAQRSFPPSAVFLAGALSLLALSGCSHKYTPDDASTGGAGSATGDLLAARPGSIDFLRGRSFYPLAVGNRWDYHVRTRSQVTTDAGPQPPQVVEQSLATEIVGTEQHGDHEYFTETQFDPDVHPTPVALGIPLRESRSGLFELIQIVSQSQADAVKVDPVAQDLAAYVDGTIADPVRRAAFQRAAAEVAAKLAAARADLDPLRPNRGAEPNELTVLSYPLYVGARWVVNASPRFGRIVVARERIAVPLGTFPAWKLRGTSELFGPDDRVYVWYSDLGLLRLRYHVFADAVDDTGNVIGRIVTDQDQSLTAIHLAGRTASAGLAGGN